MELIIIKTDGRPRMLCVREDGSKTEASLGEGLPYHDLAHYVVERKFGLREGFFGLISSGKGIQELGQAEVVRQLGGESWLAEVLTRTLQGLENGAGREEDYAESVRWEMGESGTIPPMNASVVREMREEYADLCRRWNTLPLGEALRLKFKLKEI